MPMRTHNMADTTTPVVNFTPGASPAFPAAAVQAIPALTLALEAVTPPWSREEYKLLQELLTVDDHQNPVESRWERVKRHYESQKKGQCAPPSHNSSALQALEGTHQLDSSARQSTGGPTLNALRGVVNGGVARMSSNSVADQEKYALPNHNTSVLPALEGEHESDSSAKQSIGGLTLNAASAVVNGGVARVSSSSMAEQLWPKGRSWTAEEHKLFLSGLKEFGKSNWKSISRKYVTTRTPTQIASHAQKYFIRLKRNKSNCRTSIHDIVNLDGGGGDRLQGGQGPITDQSSPFTMPTEDNANEGNGDVLQGSPGPITGHASPPATPASGQPHVHAGQPEFQAESNDGHSCPPKTDSESMLRFFEQYLG